MSQSPFAPPESQLPSRRPWRDRILATDSEARRRQRAVAIADGLLLITSLLFSILALFDAGIRPLIGYTAGSVVIFAAMLILNRFYPRTTAWLVVVVVVLLSYITLIPDPKYAGSILSISVLLAGVTLGPLAMVALAVGHLVAAQLLFSGWSGGDIVVLITISGVGWLQTLGLEAMVAGFAAKSAALNHSSSALQAQSDDQAVLIMDQQQQTAELQMLLNTVQALDVTLITLTPEMLLVPLIGAYHPERIKHLRTQLLERLAATPISTVIFDLTAQQTLLPEVTEAIARTVRAVRLLGTAVILTGIQRELARVLVKQGVEVGNIQVCRTIGEALATAQSATAEPLLSH